MKSLFLWAAMLALPDLAACAAAESSLPDGTLLFLENCNSVVEWRTKSDVAHVALLFHEGADAWVYEATPGKVRRILFDDYLTELSRLNRRRDNDEKIHILALRPESPYGPAEVVKMRTYL